MTYNGFILLHQEPAFTEAFGNGLERLVSQGLFYFYRKRLRYDFCAVYFVSLRLAAPGSLRMIFDQQKQRANSLKSFTVFQIRLDLNIPANVFDASVTHVGPKRILLLSLGIKMAK